MISRDGVLSFTPAHDANGTARVTVNAFAAQGGETLTRSFTVTVLAVNDPPSFTAGPDQSVAEDAGAQTRDHLGARDQRRPAGRVRPVDLVRRREHQPIALRAGRTAGGGGGRDADVRACRVRIGNGERERPRGRQRRHSRRRHRHQSGADVLNRRRLRERPAVLHGRGESDRARGQRRTERRALGDRDQPRPRRRGRPERVLHRLQRHPRPLRGGRPTRSLGKRHADLHARARRERHRDGQRAAPSTTAASRTAACDTSAVQTFTISVTRSE